ncbi:CPBP family intramembrane metalloprotease [Enterobacteriaceae bacterium 4M9]|nr:CPBP family intramembrane metalloprotease [Enterobacteriaceae bacterium 4M9]
MMEQSLTRVVHSGVCLAAFLGWYLCSILAWGMPGFSALYQSGLAVSFLHVAILLPFSLFAWKIYCAHYPFLPLGRFSLRGLLLPLLAISVLALIYGNFAHPEPWMDSFDGQTTFVKAMTIFSICLCAPIGEEIIFRGLVLNSSIGWGRWAKRTGIVITSLVFCAVHSQYQTAASFIYLFIFSAILCVVRINTRSLIMPMALHAINNMWAVLIMFVL